MGVVPAGFLGRIGWRGRPLSVRCLVWGPAVSVRGVGREDRILIALGISSAEQPAETHLTARRCG